MTPLLKWRRIRIIWTCHEWAPHEGKGELYCAALGHFMLRVSDHVIVHSTEMLKVVRRKYNAIPRSRLSLLPHGDLGSIYSYAVDQEFIRQRPNNPLRFASVGYMRPNKGTDLIIHAFRSINRADIRLVLAGNCIDPLYRSKLLSLANGDERIQFRFGDVEDSDLMDLHVFVRCRRIRVS